MNATHFSPASAVRKDANIPMMTLRKSKILKMKLASFFILAAVCFLHPVAPNCLVAHFPKIECQEVRQNYTSVPLHLNDSVSILKLSYNNISLNENDTMILQNYIFITELYLDNNAISVIRNYSFGNLLDLAVLDISNNSIHTVQPAAFAGLCKLRVLYLQNNQLLQLDPNPLYFGTKVSFNLTRISLSGNPWNCTCGLFSLQIWLNNTNVTMQNENNTVCVSPTSLKKHPIKTAIVKQCEKTEMNEPTPKYAINSIKDNTTSENETRSDQSYAEHHTESKSWTFMMGVLVAIICTSLLTVGAIKFPAWYRYLVSYNHSRLNELEPEMFEETFTPHMCTYSETAETKEDFNDIFEQFHTFAPEEDGFIEDKYIDT